MSDARRFRISRRYAMRAAGSALFLGLIFWLLPTDAIVEALSRITLRQFSLAVAGFVLLHMLAAAKWWLLLDLRLSPFLAVRAHFAGLAGNLCLPGAIGGDAVRGAVAYASIRDGSAVVAAGVADRLIDFTALICLTLFGLVLAVSHGGSFVLTAEVVIVFGVLVALGILGLVLLPHVWTVFPSLPGKALALKLRGAFATLAQRRHHLAVAFFISIFVQYSLIVIAGKLARAVGADVEPGYWLFAWSLAKLVAVLPVSLNGLGVREIALVAILSPLAPGLDAVAIVAAGLVWQAVIFVAGGFGGIVLFLTPQAKLPPPAVPADTATER